MGEFENLEVINVQGDSVLFRYYEMEFVAYVTDDGRRVEFPKRVWTNKTLFSLIARLVKAEWALAHGLLDSKKSGGLENDVWQQQQTAE